MTADDEKLRSVSQVAQKSHRRCGGDHRPNRALILGAEHLGLRVHDERPGDIALPRALVDRC
jgi:hypothetical protein